MAHTGINPTTAGNNDPEFVDCEETIKHEMKEEGDNEFQIDPLKTKMFHKFKCHVSFSHFFHFFKAVGPKITKKLISNRKIVIF